MLTDKQILNAKRKVKSYRLADGGGLYLEVSPTGSKYWRMKYRFAGKEKRLAIGVYPRIKSAEARAKAAEAKAKLVDGTDPSAERKVAKLAGLISAANTFEAVAREWCERRNDEISPGHAAQIIKTMENELFPIIGGRPVSTIETSEVISALRRIEKRGALEVASKARQWCAMVFRYAIATGRAKHTMPENYRKIIAPLIATARGFLERGESLAPIAFVCSFSSNTCIPVSLQSSSMEAKDRSALAIEAAAESLKADFIFVLMEAWSLRKDKVSQMDAILDKYGSIGASPYAVDVVSMALETRHGVWMAEVPIKPKGISKKSARSARRNFGTSLRSKDGLSICCR